MCPPVLIRAQDGLRMCPRGRKAGGGHSNCTICVCQHSIGHRMGLKCAQEAEIQVFGHKNGTICAHQYSFGHKISQKCAQLYSNCPDCPQYLLTRLIQQVQYGFECNSAVAAQANLASAAGGITFHARGGFCSVNKGAFYL